MKKILYSLTSAAVLVAALPKLADAAIVTQTFSDFYGTFDSVVLPIGSQQLPTGTITARQNPNLPSIATFDTNNKTAIYALNFLLDFPLLKFLGLGPVPVAPSETGFYQLDGQDLIADVKGGSKIGGSSPFAGIETFFQVRWRVTSPLDTSIYLGVIESEIVDICLSATRCVQTQGNGEAFLARTAVPEPSFLLGFFILGTLGAATACKRKNQSLAPEQKSDCKRSEGIKQQEKPSRINNNLGAIKSESYHPDEPSELLQ